MLEVALDGALLKFLLDEVDDPVCHQVFEKINNDESRHHCGRFRGARHDRARQGPAVAASISSATTPLRA